MFAIFNEKSHCPVDKFYNLMFYQSERTRNIRMATAKVIENSISVRYSEIGYILLCVFDGNVLKK